ncbi:MAG: AMP-dependent synthetase [Chlorobiaceae bacterium]|nr:AMP-dependent synthetase [Chlorobiaceae bacterium]
MTIDKYLDESVFAYPDKNALVCGSKTFTYKSIGILVERFAGFLLTAGINAGDRVAISLDNSPEAVISIFGVLKAGGTIVLIPPGTTSERMSYILDNCEPRYMIAQSIKLEQLLESVKKGSKSPAFIFTGSNVPRTVGFNFDDILQTANSSGNNTIKDDDVAAIVYTSGSTGKPKGVVLTHRNFDIVTDSVGEYLAHTPNDIILNFLPLSITYGLLQLLVTFRTGGRLILEKGFGYPYEIIKKIKEDNITGFAGVPTVYSIITHLNLEKETFPHLRYITNAAAAMPHSFIPRLRKIFPDTKIFLMHGLTECLRTTYLPPEEIDTRYTSVGKGMKHVQLWLEDANGKRLPSGEVGEMFVSGPNIMKGYWNDPESTSKVLRDGKFSGEKILRTGDLFMMDDDGYFHFVGRTDDIIKSRGKKISPLEIENVIYLLDDVLEVRVVGVPDTLLGNAIKAEIVLKKNAELTVEQVKVHCKKHLEDFQIPQMIEFVSALPKSAGGKIKRML